ncbi:MAG: CHAD domain-containing protein [Alphaproteobacteria bacterium]|nr:CHAD domain-containing protein [Alphaproteobacteria bacterium]
MDSTRTATIRSVARVPVEPSAVTARPVHLSRRMTLEDAFRVTVLECLAHVAANVPAVVRSRDAEGLHQLRVGLRRLQVAFSAFGDEFRTPVLEDLKTRTKAFADAVAPARDLDVFIAELFEPMAAKFSHQDAFATLRRRAEEARRRAWNDAVDHVASADFAAFQDDVAAAAEERGWRANADPNARRERRLPVKQAAPRLMEDYLKRVRKRARHLRALDQRRCHRLRLALKKLRYAAEFYGPLYRGKTVKRYVERLKSLQDLLGQVNDVAQVRAMLNRLTIDEAAPGHVQADLSFVAGLIDGWHQAHAERLSEKAIKRIDKFKRTEPFWA